jgi:hypothetical protein
MPVGTHPHLLVVGAGSRIAVRHAMHGWGLGRVKSGGYDPRISICREASVRGLLKCYLYTNVRISRSDRTNTSFQCWVLLTYYHVYGWDMYLVRIWAARRVVADLSWRWALEMATNNREATPW